MARQLHRLSARTVATLKTPGRHSDGGGLVLHIDSEGRRRWTFRFRWGARVRDMGLGPFPAISLADARNAAEKARRLVAKDVDPIAERSKEKETKSVSFGEAADELIASFEDGWKNAKHAAQWKMTLTEYCGPIRKKPVAEIDTADVLSVLKPIWQSKPETASRLRGRIERVLAYAKVKGWRSGENPAQWRFHLDAILPSPRKGGRGNHKALPYPEVPAFVASLREQETVARLALEFTILTAARSGETTKAEWSEFDLAEKVWTVPADRMKARKAHRVPLCDRAVKIIQHLAGAKNGRYVFWGRDQRGEVTHLSHSALPYLIGRLKVDCTVHGFRSSFKDWASETTAFANEVSEAALAHTISNAVEKAYRRGDLMTKRRALMDAWAQFIETPPAGNVVAFARADA